MALWNIDTTHAQANFAARHMMITTVRGNFNKITGTINFDPANPSAASVEAVIDTTSISSTGNEQRDGHLKSPDFLDIEKFPTITFKSTKVEAAPGATEAKITGDLTIKGVTKSVVLDAEFLGQGQSPFGTTVAGFNGKTKINREDFGLNWNMALEAGGWLVGKDVTIELDLEAIKATEAAPA
ncbi:MAG: YceI family protein [Chloroflexi bacterium]|nr:YceI family protein [Chloroflexota bacterium]MCC6894992.1 YceI family protein [Anaerolineae bacterium]